MEEPPTPTRPGDNKDQDKGISGKGELCNGINPFTGQNSRYKANQSTRYTCGEREGTCPGGLNDRIQKEDSARSERGSPVPPEGSIGGSGRRQATSIRRDEEEPQTRSVWPFPVHKPGDYSCEDFKEVHGSLKFGCNKFPRNYNTKSNMVKHENKCTLAPHLLAYEVD